MSDTVIRTDDETGQRFYEIDGENFWSVTTALSIINKEGLPRWSASLAAAFAFEELPTILSASMVLPCGRTYYKCKHDWREPHIAGECPCRRCETCVRKQMVEIHNGEKTRRANEGKSFHDVAEWWALHDGEWIGYIDTVAPYVEAFRAFIAEYGIEPGDFLWTEAIIINRTQRYAGTTDGVLQIHANRTRAAAEVVAKLLSKNTGEQITAEDAAAQNLTVTVIFDWKTQEKTVEKQKFYPDQALQGVGYKRAETIRIKNTDIEERMPHTDGVLLVHLLLDGCTARLTVCDDNTFDAFLKALHLFRWFDEFGTASISVRSFPLPKPAKATKTPARKAASPAADKPPVKRAAPAKRAAAPAARPSATLRSMAPLAVVGAGHPRGAQLTDADIPF